MDVIKQEFESFMQRLEATGKVDADTRDLLRVAFKIGVIAELEHTFGVLNNKHDT